MELFLVILVILVLARLAGVLMEKIGQTAILGELLAGVVLGVLVTSFPTLLPQFVDIGEDDMFKAVTELGIFFLIFMAGMEIRLEQLAKAAKGGALVALGGVLVPLALGYGLGWLWLPERCLAQVGHLSSFANQVRLSGFEHVVLLGTGGSSLAAWAFERIFGPADGYPRFSVLDSTVPQEVLASTDGADPAHTLFIVASKSGTTTEVLSFFEYFYDQIKQIRGGAAGENFVAITDPGTPLAQTVQERGLRATFENWPDVGGRYSGLSYFGMLPAALMGLPVREILAGDDHLSSFAAALAAAKHPVIEIEVADVNSLGQEIFRWEFAVAVTGALMGINPFDQPDVEESKAKTREMLANHSREGGLAQPAPDLADEGLAVYGAPDCDCVSEALAALLVQANAGDYVALMAYLPYSLRTDDALATIRSDIRDRLRVATTAGYGPRFLHSTGQLHKGGPNTGVFLQLTARASAALPIPAHDYDFATLKDAQASGDFEVLRQRQRRIMRIDLGTDIDYGMAKLAELISQALRQISAGVG